jgi:hypothetical protein
MVKISTAALPDVVGKLYHPWGIKKQEIIKEWQLGLHDFSRK